MANPIYTSNMRILNATGFLSNMSRTTPSPDAVYTFIAKTTPWALDSNGIPVETPIEPTMVFADELVTRSEIISLKRLSSSTVAHVVPRYTWTNNTVYTAYSVNATDLYNTNFYVVTDENNVYKCLNNNGGAPSTVKPTGTSTSAITLADGYVWKFMYDIPTSMVSTFLTTSWLPVPVGSQKTSLQQAVENAAAYGAGQPVGGNGSNAFLELGAYRLMLVFRFEGAESGKFPVNTTYRKVGIMTNPELTSGALASASLYESSEIDVNSGNMIYVEHIAPVTRNVSQNEDYKVVIEF